MKRVTRRVTKTIAGIPIIKNHTHPAMPVPGLPPLSFFLVLSHVSSSQMQPLAKHSYVSRQEEHEDELHNEEDVFWQ